MIVDDCSTDGTFAILQRLADSFPQIRLYKHEKNAGKGAAVRTAIQKADGDFSLIQDADLEYDPPSMRACCVLCSMGTPTRCSVRATWRESRLVFCPFGTR
ncbi:MAG: glycosyltransferase family 2 protein [Ignavibacteriota bacterium]